MALKFPKRGQGGLEYLLLIGGGIVVAVTIIVLIFGMAQTGQQPAQQYFVQYEQALGATGVPSGVAALAPLWNIACGGEQGVKYSLAVSTSNNISGFLTFGLIPVEVIVGEETEPYMFCALDATDERTAGISNISVDGSNAQSMANGGCDAIRFLAGDKISLSLSGMAADETPEDWVVFYKGTTEGTIASATNPSTPPLEISQAEASGFPFTTSQEISGAFPAGVSNACFVWYG